MFDSCNPHGNDSGRTAQAATGQISESGHLTGLHAQQSMTKPLLRSFMPELNSIRGLACLAVLFFHGLWWNIPSTATGLEGLLRDWTSQGFRGVEVFFVLSGLLITGILRDSRDHPNYFSRFYKRRALRILPPYYMMLILLALYGMPRGFLAISLLHAANMAPMLGITMGYGPLWSLAVEEQFYLVWPACIRRFSNLTVAVLSMGIFVQSLVLVLGLRNNSPQSTFPIWYAAHGLAMGDLLALFLRSRWAKRRVNVSTLATVLLLVGYVGIRLSHRAWSRPQLGMMFQGGWDFVFAGVLLFAMLVATGRFEAWTRPRWLQFFGDISYGLYLIHVLVFKVYDRWFHTGSGLRAILLQFLICSALSIALAALSRFTVEEWFLRWKDRPLPQLWRHNTSATLPIRRSFPANQ